ncbi:MAG: OadG family protein [Firmicutes bacterium]|nr:OadG family protein [Bacillota bacterium]
MDLKEILIKALMDTLMGMGTVFLILILISFIIYMFKVLFYNNKKPVPAQETPLNEAVPEEDDGELIAVITAAIAAFEAGAPCTAEIPVSGQQYVVRSIRRRR